MITYEIIDQIFKMELNGFELPKHWRQFQYFGPRRVDLEMQLIHKNLMNRDIEYVFMPGCEHLMFSGESMMCADQEYRKVYICNPDGINTFQTFAAYAFYTHAVRRQILWIHSATIQIGDIGVLFLGPSGIGKTTQAELWKHYLGASIINGDVGFVQRTSKGYIAWGTPWHGSSLYCMNTQVPVRALVVLKQSPVNKLRELKDFEKVVEVSDSIMYPNWIPDGRELCVENLNHLLRDLPVYRLDNRADLESVKILKIELERIG